MGCDIHMYLEYTDKKTLERENKGVLNGRGEPIKAYWRNFGGRINPGRNYWMFGILSKGVRSNFDEGFNPKGIPDFHSLSFSCMGDYTLYISDKDDDRDDDDVRNTTLEKAIKWASEGYGSVLYYRDPTDDKPFRVSSPDWHSASWLTTEEYEKAIQIYKDKCIEAYRQEPEYNSPDDAILPEYEALLAAMKSLDSNGMVCRVVFWFDN